MALREALLLRLGGAVAKSVLSLWLGNVAVVGGVSGVAVETVLGRVPNLGMFERRRAARQFERMAEAAAEGRSSSTASVSWRRLVPREVLRQLRPREGVLLYGHLPPARV